MDADLHEKERELDALEAKYDNLREQYADVLTILKEIQFKGHNGVCPICRCNARMGHMGLCRIGKAVQL